VLADAADSLLMCDVESGDGQVEDEDALPPDARLERAQ
jgi:hypothetical protein